MVHVVKLGWKSQVYGEWYLYVGTRRAFCLEAFCETFGLLREIQSCSLHITTDPDHADECAVAFSFTHDDYEDMVVNEDTYEEHALTVFAREYARMRDWLPGTTVWAWVTEVKHDALA